MASGKSSLANLLCESEPRFIKLSFAGKIKILARELFGMETKDRHLLQQIGTKMREIRSSVWIDYLLAEAEDKSFVVVDDVRYPDELQALRSAGFTIVYLEVDPEVQRQRLQQTYGTEYTAHLQGINHVSERADHYVSQSDIVAHPQSLEELQALAKSLLHTHKHESNN